MSKLFDTFREIEKQQKGVEKSLNAFVAHIVSESNYHVSVLNTYREGKRINNAFEYHAIAYCVMQNLIGKYQQIFDELPEQKLNTCQHDMTKYFKKLEE